MAIRTHRSYRYVPPVPYPSKTISNFSTGLDTKNPETDVTVRRAENVRFNLATGWITRDGSQQKGNQLGTAAPVSGLHSYVKTNQTAYLLTSYNGEIYNYSQSGTSSTIATSTNSSPLGNEKDRNVFFTSTNLDASGNPYLVVLYQSGSGILLEWSQYPYTGWANTPVTIDTSTQIFLDGSMNSDDSIDVVYQDTANSTKYVKLTFSAGPTWTVGTKHLVAGSGSSDTAAQPSFCRQAGGRLHASYTNFDGSNTNIVAKYSNDSGSTWIGTTTILAAGSAPQSALAVVSDTPTIVVYQGDVGGSIFQKATWSTTWTSLAVFTPSGTVSASNSFSLTVTADGLTVYVGNGTSGSALTSFGTGTGATQRFFSVVNDGVNDNDIQYQDIVNGTISPTKTRITNDSNNNLQPNSPATVSSTASYVPVVFVTGTTSPYSIKVNSSAQWTALSASLTAGFNVESATMPFTAAGGTGQIYFVNNKDSVKKWDGTTLTSATATSYPKPAWIFAQDNRLHMGGGTGVESTWWYTNLGADNFTGTFPTSNRVDWPEAIVHGMWYRDSVSFFFSRNAIYVAENFDYTGVTPNVPRKIPDSYGTLSARTIQQVGYYVYYQRPDGQIMRTNGQSCELVSDRIYPTLQNISLSQLQSACAGTVGPYYYLSVTNAESGENDITIVLDTRSAPNGGFSIDTGKYGIVYVTHPDENGVPQLYFGDSRLTVGTVYESEVGTTDNGMKIVSTVETGIIVTGDLFSSDLLRDTLVISQTTVGASLSVGWTGFTNTNTFTSKTYSIDPGASEWGIGSWGDGRIWGGTTNVEELISNINLLDRGFKFQYVTSPTNGPVQFISQTITFQRVTDRV